MSKAHQLIQEDEHYFAKSGRIKYYPLVIDHGYGATLVDIEGKTDIDLLSSASSQNVGHAPREVTEAIKAQVDKFIHYTPAYMYHEPLVRLAKKLCEITPGDFEKRVTFDLTGSDANDGIIKFARAYTGRPYIISFTNAYHGSTFGSLSMSAISLNMRKHYGPLLNGFYHIPFPDKYRGMYEQPQANSVEEYLAPLKEMFAKYVPADEVACIVIETIQGDGGLLEPVPGYQWVSKYNSVGDVRGKGLSIGIDIVSDKKLKTRDGSAALKICNYCFEHGVVIIAVAGNVLRFQPPLVITYEQLDTALNTIEDALTALEAGNLDQYDISGQGW